MCLLIEAAADRILALCMGLEIIVRSTLMMHVVVTCDFNTVCVFITFCSSEIYTLRSRFSKQIHKFKNLYQKIKTLLWKENYDMIKVSNRLHPTADVDLFSLLPL